MNPSSKTRWFIFFFLITHKWDLASGYQQRKLTHAGRNSIVRQSHLDGNGIPKRVNEKRHGWFTHSHSSPIAYDGRLHWRHLYACRRNMHADSFLSAYILRLILLPNARNTSENTITDRVSQVVRRFDSSPFLCSRSYFRDEARAIIDPRKISIWGAVIRLDKGGFLRVRGRQRWHCYQAAFSVDPRTLYLFSS